MQTFEILKAEYKVADFLDWQRSGALDLRPVFQRRTVWKPGAKSFLVDTVARGLPTPIIFLRDRVDLRSLRPTREVVDGQQRLRTLISFIDPGALSDFDETKDDFTVRRAHNPDLADKRFGELDSAAQHRILNYSFSTHVMPSSVEDRDILMIFQRLNSTGEKLSPQELRNAEFFGEFKTLMYELAHEQLERWRGWGVFSDEQIGRMKEVELTSDLVLSMLAGFGAKTQKRLDRAYAEFDEEFPQARTVSRRFQRTMNSIGDLLGDQLTDTIYAREIWFVILYVYLYDRLFRGIDISVRNATPKKIPARIKRGLLEASERVAMDRNLPRRVADALRGASSDARSRQARLDFVSSIAD